MCCACGMGRTEVIKFWTFKTAPSITGSQTKFILSLLNKMAKDTRATVWCVVINNPVDSDEENISFARQKLEGRRSEGGRREWDASLSTYGQDAAGAI